MLVFFVGIVSNVLIKEYVKYRKICTLYISTFLSSFKQKQKVDRFHAELMSPVICINIPEWILYS